MTTYQTLIGLFAVIPDSEKTLHFPQDFLIYQFKDDIRVPELMTVSAVYVDNRTGEKDTIVVIEPNGDSCVLRPYATPDNIIATAIIQRLRERFTGLLVQPAEIPHVLIAQTL